MLTQIAQTLEDAADYILMHGLHRGAVSNDEGRYCAIGTIYQVCPDDDVLEEGLMVAEKACDALDRHLRATGVITRPSIVGHISPVAEWSDASEDDFVVIDALRHCAKDIRNTVAV